MRQIPTVWIFWILLFSLVSILPVMASIKLAGDLGQLYIVSYATVLTFLTAIFYWRDKKFAQIADRRVSERTLHLFELAGGWIAAYWMQRLIRHKIRKGSYQIRFWGISALHQYISFDYLNDWEYSKTVLYHAAKYLY